MNFPDQGVNLDWRADSYPLDHQGSPVPTFTNCKSFSSDLTLCFIIFYGYQCQWIFQCSQADGLHDNQTGLVVCNGVEFSSCSMARLCFDWMVLFVS